MKAIEYEMVLINKTGSITNHLEVVGTAKRLDSHKELILFRIVQESLNNIIKHAEASSINIRAVYSSANLELTIQDNGKGFKNPVAINEMESGSGIRNMKSRATVIGGNMEIFDNNGTQIRINIPINEA